MPRDAPHTAPYPLSESHRCDGTMLVASFGGSEPLDACARQRLTVTMRAELTGKEECFILFVVSLLDVD